MNSQFLLPLLAALSVASILLDRQTAKAQTPNPDARQTDLAGNSSSQIRQIPAISVGIANQTPEKTPWDASKLRIVGDSIQLDRRNNTTRKQSDSPLDFFKPSGLPSSVKVPVHRF